MNPFSMLTGGGDRARAAANPLAFAVTGQQVVLGGLSLVQQTIRDAKNAKADAGGTDPLVDYALQFLPAQAGAFMFDNQQLRMEIAWTQLKESALAAAKAVAAGGDPAVRRNRMMGPMEMAGMGAMSPMTAVVEMLKDYVDFTTLPDFAAVRAYFGAEVSYVVSTDDGILLEVRNVKPPAK
jgi:hypothetical protein